MRLLVWWQLSCCPGYVTGREKAGLGGAVEPGGGEGGGEWWQLGPALRHTNQARFDQFQPQWGMWRIALLERRERRCAETWDVSESNYHHKLTWARLPSGVGNFSYKISHTHSTSFSPLWWGGEASGTPQGGLISLVIIFTPFPSPHSLLPSQLCAGLLRAHFKSFVQFSPS